MQLRDILKSALQVEQKEVSGSDREARCLALCPEALGRREATSCPPGAPSSCWGFPEPSGDGQAVLGFIELWV